MKKSRDISILDFLENLQLEYLLYELRSKIYPKKDDKQKYKEIMQFKEDKIFDICSKNNLRNIFNDGEILQEIESKFYNEFGNPKEMTNRDKYFYYLIGSDFSYNGQGVKLLSYNLQSYIATIELKNKQSLNVDLNFIKRIL
jgi:hypothetical protein